MGILYRFKRKIEKRLKSKADRLINDIIEKKMTYLSVDALQLLATSVKEIENNNIKGDIIETGCALGGSSILISKIKKSKRNFLVFDSFEMMPEPTDNDDSDVHKRFEVIKKGDSKGIDGDLYYGYEKDLLNKVKTNFRSFDIDLSKNNIKLIKGYYEDTLEINNEVAFAHIDCDWYDSVMISLEKIVPFLSMGGILIIDDYFYYSGCKKATDDYFSDKKDHYEFIEKERLVIRKIS